MTPVVEDIDHLVPPLVPRPINLNPTHHATPHQVGGSPAPPLLLPKRIPQSGTIAAAGMRPPAAPAERD